MALVKRGYQVTMLDGGVELETDRALMLKQLERQDAASWDAATIQRLKENMQSGTSGVALKYVYGSDFPYRETDTFIPRSATHAGIVSSLAKGGLSNVWGAAVLPYASEDIVDWPISIDELAPHYRAVLGFMRIAAADDALSSRFPLYCDNFHALPQSRQIEKFLADLRKNRQQLNARGFLFGGARVAVSAQNPHGYACAACGLCTYGCPYGLIYNSATTLDELIAYPGFTYVPDVVVTKLTEAGDEVTIQATSRSRSKQLSFQASRVYVGAGVLSTTKLLLESMQAYNHVLTVKDSQYFLLPLLRYSATPDVTSERVHTLPQAFIEVFDSKLSERSVHLQVYGYNELHGQAIQGLMGPFHQLFGFVTKAMLERLLLIFGFLHSDVSPTISISLQSPRDGEPSTLLIEGHDNPQTKTVLRQLVAKIAGSRSLLKAVPLFPMLKSGEPGRGFHSGGTFPMRAKPGEFESDLLGRPYGFNRVHLVDSSSFPTIPANTITLSVMANAHRIASACDEPGSG
jgi:choline dehydrogenase-like flavoprotein